MYENGYDRDDDSHVSADNSYSIVFASVVFTIAMIFVIIYHCNLKNEYNKEIEKRGKLNKIHPDETITPEICTICYTPYNPKDKLLTLNCDHSYHLECAKSLFSNNGLNTKCPYCKKDLLVEN